jgi:succinyl-CoA synthetase alpha subunit
LFHQLCCGCHYGSCRCWNKVIIAITEGIPVADMIKANSYVKERNARLIGPNCPEYHQVKLKLVSCQVLF